MSGAAIRELLVLGPCIYIPYIPDGGYVCVGIAGERVIRALHLLHF